jgi:hypothetical protein
LTIDVITAEGNIETNLGPGDDIDKIEKNNEGKVEILARTTIQFDCDFICIVPTDNKENSASDIREHAIDEAILHIHNANLEAAIHYRAQRIDPIFNEIVR